MQDFRYDLFEISSWQVKQIRDLSLAKIFLLDFCEYSHHLHYVCSA
jgi:hypothetical protein